MFTIRKQFAFSASHWIDGLAAGHPCGRLHGHNYVVEIELRAPALNAVGFVRDYRELAALREFIDGTLDHRHLNEVMGHDQTTSEHLAQWLYEWCRARWPETSAVRVSETPKTWAEYRP